MIDMPAALANVQNIDWGRVQDAVADYGPAIDIIKKTWSRESLLDIMNGHIAVPDDVINEAIANRLPADGSVKSLQVTSKSNGRLDILADTKKAGRIELSGNIDAFVHDGDQSYMTYHVRERALKDHGLMSWVFSRLSMSMAERLVKWVRFRSSWAGHSAPVQRMATPSSSRLTGAPHTGHTSGR